MEAVFFVFKTFRIPDTFNEHIYFTLVLLVITANVGTLLDLYI